MIESLHRAIANQDPVAMNKAIDGGANPFTAFNGSSAWETMTRDEAFLAVVGNSSPEGNALRESVNRLSTIGPSGYEEVTRTLGAQATAQQMHAFRESVQQNVARRLADTGLSQAEGGVKTQASFDALERGSRFVRDAIGLSSGLSAREAMNAYQDVELLRQRTKNSMDFKGTLWQSRIEHAAAALVEKAPLSENGFLALPTLAPIRVEQAINTPVAGEPEIFASIQEQRARRQLAVQPASPQPAPTTPRVSM